MQRHQHNKFILNQPQKICTSTQSHWKDKSVINNFHVYDKLQLKTETSENTQERETDIVPLNSSLGEHYYSLWRETTSTR